MTMDVCERLDSVHFTYFNLTIIQATQYTHTQSALKVDDDCSSHGGLVVQWVGHWTCVQKVAHSTISVVQ